MTTLRAAAALAALGLALAARAETSAPATAARPEADAVKASEAWLALLDAGKVEESWDAASALFRSKVTKERWVLQVKGVRGKLGGVKARALDKAVAIKVEGADAWVVLWNSRLDGLPEGSEAVTMVKDGDAWRCAGYFVRPRS